MSDKRVVVRRWEEPESCERLLDAFSPEDALELIECDIALTMGKGWRSIKLEIDRRVVADEVESMYRAFDKAKWKADGAREGSEGAYVDKGSVYVVFKPQPQND